jgi:hypothetical protein
MERPPERGRLPVVAPLVQQHGSKQLPAAAESRQHNVPGQRNQPQPRASIPATAADSTFLPSCSRPNGPADDAYARYANALAPESGSTTVTKNAHASDESGCVVKCTSILCASTIMDAAATQLKRGRFPTQQYSSSESVLLRASSEL